MECTLGESHENAVIVVVTLDAIQFNRMEGF